MFNRGLGGYSTNHARAILNRLAASGRPPLAAGDGWSSAVLATIFFGANDASGPHSFQSVPLEVAPLSCGPPVQPWPPISVLRTSPRTTRQAYADNLREIIRLLRKAAPGEPANR